MRYELNKKSLSDRLKKIGLYKPVRSLYNKIRRFNKQTEIIFNNKKIKFWTPTFFLDNYIKNLAGEKELLDEVFHRLKDENTFWDIGANVGLYSILVARIKTASKIYSFEPEPHAFDLLKKNIKLNKVTNIISLPLALGDFIGEKILFSSDTPNFGSHSFIQRPDFKLKKNGKFIKVYDADSLIKGRKADVPDIIKIDVEGAEILVLRGMKDLLKNPKLKIIVCEIHTNLLPFFNSSENEIKNIIKQESFRMDLFQNRGSQNHYIFVR